MLRVSSFRRCSKQDKDGQRGQPYADGAVVPVMCSEWCLGKAVTAIVHNVPSKHSGCVNPYELISSHSGRNFLFVNIMVPSDDAYSASSSPYEYISLPGHAAVLAVSTAVVYIRHCSGCILSLIVPLAFLHQEYHQDQDKKLDNLHTS